jgi:putative oxidoreductase
MAYLSNLGRYKDTGLLILRIGLGIMFIMHGYPKLFGGPEKWEAVGGAMRNIHVTAFPVIWGFLAGITETFGGFMLLLGLAFRPVCIALTFMMIIAALSHISRGRGIMEASHAIEAAFVFFALIFIGPGKYSVDKK